MALTSKPAGLADAAGLGAAEAADAAALGAAWVGLGVALPPQAVTRIASAASAANS
jgi:hypothetical protein